MSRVSAGENYWIVSCSAVDQGRENIFSILRSRVQKNGLVGDSAVFDVPSNLKFGSFDELIRTADELPRHDSTCEQVVHRLEKQILELNPAAELRLYLQRTTMSMEQLLHRFTWDDARFSRNRYLRENLEILVNSVARLDEIVRIKTAAYNESRQSQMSEAKKDTTSFYTKDLTMILTSKIVLPDDFIETKYLTTVVVVVRSGGSKDWLAKFESLDPFVIPRSTRKFEAVDKEGNSLWKVTLFRRSLENFTNACKKNKFMVREFLYSPTAADEALSARAQLEAEKSKQELFLSRVCISSFTDACVAWLHIKAMRVFTESVLRFGVPPNFAAFLLKPCPGREGRLRRELEDLFTTKGIFGRAFIESSRRPPKQIQQDNSALAAEGIDEEYYSYVSFTFIPLQYYIPK